MSIANRVERERIADRVRKLVALAASDSLEEARSAAHEALRLVREHDLVLTVALDTPKQAEAKAERVAKAEAWKERRAARERKTELDPAVAKSVDRVVRDVSAGAGAVVRDVMRGAIKKGLGL